MCLSCCTRSSQHHSQDDISTHSMPLVDCLCIVYATIKLWYEVLCETNQRLDEQKRVCDQSELPMHAFEVDISMIKFEIFDYHDGGGKRIESDIIDGEVNNGALSLLSCSMCRLEDEDRLCEEKDDARVEKRVRREERERGVEEHARPDESYQ